MQATLTSKGQMTLPGAVRARLGLEAGDHLLVTVQDDDTIILKRKPTASVTALRGLLSRPKRALRPTWAQSIGRAASLDRAEYQLVGALAHQRRSAPGRKSRSMAA